MQKAIAAAMKIPADGHGILGTISLNDQVTPLLAKPGRRRIHTGKVKRIGLFFFAGKFVDGIFPVPGGKEVGIRLAVATIKPVITGTAVKNIVSPVPIKRIVACSAG